MAPPANQQTARLLLICVVLGVLSLVAPLIVYGGARPATLAAGATLGGEVSQAIGVQDNGKLLVAGKDYSLGTPQYFQGKDWVVISLARPNVGGAYVILHRQDGLYTSVLGPGTAFAQNYTRALPSDLVQYLGSKGLLYNAL